MNSALLPESLQSLCTYITLQQRSLQAHLRAATTSGLNTMASTSITPAMAPISYEGLVSVMPTQSIPNVWMDQEGKDASKTKSETPAKSEQKQTLQTAVKESEAAPIESNSPVTSTVSTSLSSGSKVTSEPLMDESELYYNCHLCSFGTAIRSVFNDHLNSHYSFQCRLCDFETRDETAYKTHLNDEHNVNDDNNEANESNPSKRTPNGGKRFRCKRCPFESSTKSSFWHHQRLHIRREKMYACPKCNFVTDLKHHLEYHLRNHYGSKPFKCPHCTYSCVNKSMLNSHMKSHLALHQYQCQDCNYVTKYCHSLKQHLRKYGHRPGMVLNPDGTPNPLPIIDVYGTRRGPKAKNGEDDLLKLDSPFIVKEPLRQKAKSSRKRAKGNKDKDNNSQNSDKSRHLGTNDEDDGAAIDDSVMDEEAQNVSSSGENAGNSRLFESVESEVKRGGEDEENALNLSGKSDLGEPRFRCNLCNFETGIRATFDNHVAMHEAVHEEGQNKEELRKLLSSQNNQQLATHFDSHGMRYLPSSSSLPSSLPMSLPLASESSSLLSRLCMESLMSRLREQQELPPSSSSRSNSVEESDAALDLKLVSKNRKRRKGQAFKIERRSSLEAEDLRFKANLSGPFVCEHCQIAFVDEAMFEAHMSFHSEQPLTCHSCKSSFQDARQFFLHLNAQHH